MSRFRSRPSTPIEPGDPTADRRIARQICVAFALIFLAATLTFADVREWLFLAAGAMLLTAALLWTRLPTLYGALVAPLASVALLVWLYLDRF